MPICCEKILFTCVKTHLCCVLPLLRLGKCPCIENAMSSWKKAFLSEKCFFLETKKNSFTGKRPYTEPTQFVLVENAYCEKDDET